MQVRTPLHNRRMADSATPRLRDSVTGAMKSLLLTGASSGIGRACALALADGFRLVLVARRRDLLEDLVREIAARGGEAQILVADLAEPGAPARVGAEVLARCGGIHALVNNAGVFELRPTSALDPAHLERQLRLNLMAPMLLVQAVLPQLIVARGQVVNISSMAAEQPFPGCGAYAASKAGLEQWSRVLREELRRDGVRVSVVAPGATDTPIWPAGSQVDRSRMCRPEDVAAAVRSCLLAPASASIDRVVVAPPGGAL